MKAIDHDQLSEVDQKAAADAITRWGEHITDLRLLSFADRLAAGEKRSQLATEFFPRHTPGTARQLARILSRHPTISARRSLAQQTTPRDLVRSAVPSALQRLFELAMGQHGATPTVQAKAAADILDRGGLPRTAELAVSAVAVSMEAIDTVLSDSPSAPRQRLKTAGATQDQLDAARANWAALLPADVEPKT